MQIPLFKEPHTPYAPVLLTVFRDDQASNEQQRKVVVLRLGDNVAAVILKRKENGNMREKERTGKYRRPYPS
jgi:hypothetical protein